MCKELGRQAGGGLTWLVGMEVEGVASSGQDRVRSAAARFVGAGPCGRMRNVSDGSVRGDVGRRWQGKDRNVGRGSARGVGRAKFTALARST